MDEAYDNSEAYDLLRGMSVKPIIKPRRNAKANRGPPKRRMVGLIRRISDEGWMRMVGYGKRWAVKTALNIQVHLRRLLHG
ncbi:MAG: hypothetical protein QXO15_09110 [Nitrososphaerota archaeon]